MRKECSNYGPCKSATPIWLRLNVGACFSPTTASKRRPRWWKTHGGAPSATQKDRTQRSTNDREAALWKWEGENEISKRTHLFDGEKGPDFIVSPSIGCWMLPQSCKLFPAVLKEGNFEDVYGIVHLRYCCACKSHCGKQLFRKVCFFVSVWSFGLCICY